MVDSMHIACHLHPEQMRDPMWDYMGLGVYGSHRFGMPILDRDMAHANPIAAARG